MTTKRFTGRVPVRMDCYSPTGLMQAVHAVVPREQRRSTLGYRLVEITADPDDELKKLVTIEVLYK